MRVDEMLPLPVTLPNKQKLQVSEATVRWSKGNEFTVEITQVELHAMARLQHYVKQLVREPVHEQ
jgi:hypothetical protein